jgi:hypothetical protein
MFARCDGPTALRPDLVRALALSLQDSEVDMGNGPVHARAGVAAVWNGKKGLVVILVRIVEEGKLERYAFSDPILSEQELDDVVETALGFTESMGLLMGGPEFQTLDPGARETALRKWNTLRKGEAPPPEKAKRKKVAKVRAVKAKPAPPPPESEAQTVVQEGRTVLGRVPVVRKRVDPQSPKEGLGRVLASF